MSRFLVSSGSELIFALDLACMTCVWLFINIGDILSAADQPAQADVVLCLSGSPDRVKKAAELPASGLAERVVVTTTAAYRQMLRAVIDAEKIIQAFWSASSTIRRAGWPGNCWVRAVSPDGCWSLPTRIIFSGPD